MILRAALALASLLVLSGPASAAPDPVAYDAKAAPLDDLATSLLTGNGYAVRDDGKVWDTIGETPVLRADMPYLLSRLASAKRLRGLLQINNIINRYDAERKLTPEDKEAVRALVRENWEVFGLTPRNDFRSYFSIEELESLDKIPPRYDTMSPLTMTDPEPESVTGDVLPAAPISPSAAARPPAPIPPAAPAVVAPPPAQAVDAAVAPAAVAPAATAVAASALNAVPTLSPLIALPSLSRGSPFASPVAPSAAPLAVPATAAATLAAPAAAAPIDPHHSFMAETAAPPPVIVTMPAPAAPSTSAVVSSTLGTLKPWTPPAGSTATAAALPKPAPVAVATVTASAVAAAPPPPAPKPLSVSESDYDSFVAAGPYTKEGKELLSLIGKHAPDFVLPLLRRTVVGAIPQIVVDGARTGLELRAGTSRDASDPLAPPVVALSPGPVFVSVKKGLFGKKQDVVLPESESAWAELGLARPPLGALKGDPGLAPTENGDWGAVRVYPDGTRRGSYTNQEQAGELLEQLLLLGLAREGLDASPYATRRWARTGRLMFEARLKDEMKQDSFLDPDRRAELRDWLDHPDEADDLVVASWSGSRAKLLDPRRGPPEAARDFETRAKDSCARSSLEDALVEASRLRASAVGALESLLDAGVIDGAAAKAAAQAATDAESAAHKRLLAAPACAPADPARDEGLRKAALLMAESSRAERLMRERKAGLESHAL